MKRLLLAIALAASTSAAAAQPEWATLSVREGKVAQHVEAAQREGRISASEGERLRKQLHKIESLRLYYRRSHGMSAWERRDLEHRLKAIDERLAKAKARA